MTVALEYMARLYTLPMLQSDAIVVLSGEGDKRASVACELLRQQGAPLVVVTGALDKPPFSLPAAKLEAYLLGQGVSPGRILRVEEGTNTREEADAVVRLARQKKWRRVLVVTSPFHVPRVGLTFVQSLYDAGAQTELRVLIVPASQLRWDAVPAGLKKSAGALFRGELRKIRKYQRTGDIASYESGIEYLRHWERAA